MWRLKIAEGGNDPYIYSTNNFVGRQIWEFDPEAGTQEERDEVEKARQNFYKNLYQVKPSGDLLWRMQAYNLLFKAMIISSRQASRSTKLDDMASFWDYISNHYPKE